MTPPLAPAAGGTRVPVEKSAPPVTAAAKSASTPAESQATKPAQAVAGKPGAAWRCQGKPACDKAWAAAEHFVVLNSSMRIRQVTADTIDTYPPVVVGEVGLTVSRVALGGADAELRLAVHCRSGKLQQCAATEQRILAAFPGHLQAAAAR